MAGPLHCSFPSLTTLPELAALSHEPFYCRTRSESPSASGRRSASPSLPVDIRAELFSPHSSKLAAVMGETADPDPAAWFRSKFNAEPNYSDLLNRLAKAPTERAALLRQYFEPTEEERSRELKVPTKAHQAIASLVAAGHLRVLVTTNFDRLLETAITEAGVVPTVREKVLSVRLVRKRSTCTCCLRSFRR
jgi:hypothetical protein